MNIDKIIREEIQKLNETAGKNMPDIFFDRVVQQLGGTPTEEKRKFFRAWKRAEGTKAKFNPLATTLKLRDAHGGSSDMKGSVNKGNPVQDYKTLDAGVDATYWTLKNTYGGKAYQNLVNKLKSDDVTAAELAAEKDELALWSSTAPTGHYVSNIQKGVGADYTSASELEVTPQESPADSEEPAISLRATPDQIEAELQQTKDKEALTDKIQFVADWLGFIPVVGDAIDFLNAVMYFARGQYMSGTLSLIAVVPGIGSAFAVPVKTLFKGLGAIPPRVFRMLVKDPIGANTWWSKNVWSNVVGTKLDITTFKRFIDYGDDLMSSINSLSNTLRSRGFTDLAKRTDDVGKYFQNMLDSGFDYYKNIISGAKAAPSFGAPGSTTLSNTWAAAKLFGKKIFSKKLITGFSKSSLNSLNKRFLTQFQNRVVNSRAFTDLFDNYASFNTSQRTQLKNFIQQLAQQRGFGSVRINSVQDLKNIMNRLDSKSKKELIDFVLKNESSFPELYKAYTSRAGVYAASEATRLRNAIRGDGIRKFAFNVEEFNRRTRNFSVPKLYAKSAYIGQALASMDFLPDWIQNFGSNMSEFAIKSYQWILPWIFDPDRELSDEEKQQQRELEKEQRKIEQQFERLSTYDASDLTPEQQEQLQKIFEVYQAE